MYLRKENCLYQACPSQDCNKKVVDQQNGMFRCEKCDKEFPNFKYRLILSVSDSALGSLKLNSFWAVPAMHPHTSINANAHILNSCLSCLVLSRCFCWGYGYHPSSLLISMSFCYADWLYLFIFLSPRTQATLPLWTTPCGSLPQLTFKAHFYTCI